MPAQRKEMLLLFVALVCCQLCQLSLADGPAAQAWSYAGIANWGGSCQNGTLQSPLNIRTTNMSAQQQPSPVALDYSSSVTLRSEKTTAGTEQFAIPAGNNITINGTQYKAISMHWHTPSEHAINGRHGPAELHIIHNDANQNPAVIGVLYTRGSVADPLLQLFLDNEPPFVPQGQNSTGPTVTGVDLRTTVKNYIPNGTAGSFLTYKGSLTTPPCTEGVQWLVSTLNATMTDAQIVALQAAIGGNETFSTNARPVQAGSPSQLVTPL